MVFVISWNPLFLESIFRIIRMIFKSINFTLFCQLATKIKASLDRIEFTVLTKHVVLLS